MRKHNRDRRRMGALLRMYRTCTPGFIEWLRAGNISATDNVSYRWCIELRRLESILPPEMVAWAKLNR